MTEASIFDVLTETEQWPRAFGKPMVLRASVNNVFNRNYWSSSSGNWIYLGQPRTVVLSASVDF